MDKTLEDLLKNRDLDSFDNEPFIKKVDKPWGYELIFTPQELPYTGKIMHIEAGKRLSLQIHDKKLESYWLSSGRCNLVIENKKGELETIEMKKGVGYTMKVGQKHRHQAITDCDVFEVYLPETGITYRLEDDYKRNHETEEVRSSNNRGWDK